MMQALNVKTASKAQLNSKAFHQALIKQSENLGIDNINTKVKSKADEAKTASFNRFLEAYSDCV